MKEGTFSPGKLATLIALSFMFAFLHSCIGLDKETP